MKIYVYLTLNKINGKCYIGSHLSRKVNDNYLGGGSILRQAISKYGKKNFLNIVLLETCSLEEARNLEGKYISLFETLTPDGYNIHPDGGYLFKDPSDYELLSSKLSNSLSGRELSKEHIEKVRRSLTGRKRDPNDAKKTWKSRRLNGTADPWNKGKSGVYSKETIEKFKEIAKNREISEDRKRKTSESMREKHAGKKNPMAGKTIYELWVEKYGPEEADKRYVSWRSKVEKH